MDFRKKLADKAAAPKINPVEIYDSLDRASDKGPLRPAQQAILTQWFTNRSSLKDSIIKLHTGQGKTLIGLLILQSKLNQKEGPAMFICPNKHLAEQTCEQAKQFGISFCRTEDFDGNIPSDFQNSRSILITYVQKAFHGFSKFGIGSRSMDIGALVIDDSHACIDHIESSVSMKIPKPHGLYRELLTLFEDDLELQGAARLEEIQAGGNEALLPVPYWAWAEKFRQAVKLILQNKEEEFVKYAWPLLQDDIEYSRCIVNGSHIEITPYKVPIEKFGFYYNAKTRIFMSATTNNDAFFIKGLGLSKETVSNPIVYDKEKWSGEKMILVPYEMSIELNRLNIVAQFAKPNKARKFGIVGLVPSHRASKLWEANGAIIVKADDISKRIAELKSGNYEQTLVFVNRYDGIDLPDNACRILILDSRPYAQSLFDEYQEKCRADSELIDIKVSQKIEQGLGRGVRGEKDYCVIIVASPDVINNVRSKRLKKYFSPQTNKQIEIGLEIAQSAGNEAEDDDVAKVLIELINQVLKRDEGWKEYYASEMDTIEEQQIDPRILEILQLEKQAEDHFVIGQFENAKNSLQQLLDKYIEPSQQSERGWYIQEMARMMYNHKKTVADELQISAHKSNRALMRPRTGVEVKKLIMNGDRLQNIKGYYSTFENFSELMLHANNVLSALSFSMPSEKFEKGIFELGRLLGFASERPDNDWKAGPDNLWGINKTQYILFECKNEVLESRDEIHKAETGQMNNACAWFKNNYGGGNIKNVMIIPTKNVSASTGFSEDVEILRKNGLNKLKKNFTYYIGEFKNWDFASLSNDQIHTALKTHSLLEPDLLSQYFEQPYQRKS